jgi:hypothetical protein
MRKSSYKQTAVGNIGLLGRDAGVRLVPPDCPFNMALNCLKAKPVQLRSLMSHAASGISDSHSRVKTA